MADFSVEVVKVESVAPIVFKNKEGQEETANAIEAVVIGGYKSIVGKDTYKVGDLVAYIPCGSLVPVEVQKKLGVEGRLAGAGKSRVKEIKLKGILSEGLVYPAKSNWKLGDNVAEELGIQKWEQVLPAQFRGNGKKDPRTLKYDIENFKKFNRALCPGEEVVFTEKIHGTYCQIALFEDGEHYVTSKGLAEKGITLKETHTKWQRFLYKTLKFILPFAFKQGKFDQFWSSKYSENLYLRTIKEQEILPKLRLVQQFFGGLPVYLMGEVFGAGIQDLIYGVTTNKAGFRAFDLYVGTKGKDGHYVDFEVFYNACNIADIPVVPILYIGHFSEAVLKEYTTGKETVSGKSQHLREGVVIRPTHERSQGSLGRVILKSVSADYLTRKNPDATEFN